MEKSLPTESFKSLHYINQSQFRGIVWLCVASVICYKVLLLAWRWIRSYVAYEFRLSIESAELRPLRRLCVFWLKISYSLARAWNTAGSNSKIDGSALFLSPCFFRFQLFLYVCAEFMHVSSIIVRHIHIRHSLHPTDGTTFWHSELNGCKLVHSKFKSLNNAASLSSFAFWFSDFLLYFCLYICFIFVKYGRCVVKRIMESSRISNIGSVGRFSRPFR